MTVDAYLPAVAHPFSTVTSRPQASGQTTGQMERGYGGHDVYPFTP